MTDQTGKPFRWIIFGTGSVARKFTLDLLRLGDRVEICAVASRSQANADRFASDFNIEQALSNYGEAAMAGADAIYIATPPALHEEHALLTINAGKAALIEKPMAMNATSAKRIADAAQTAGVFCMEAMWTRFQPLLGEIKSIIDAGDLGRVSGFEARFMAANDQSAHPNLFDFDGGGGAMMHRGVYPLSLARFLLGPVAEVRSSAQLTDTKVDGDSVLLAQHVSGALSTIRASICASGPDGSVVYGSKATLYIDGPIWRPTRARLVHTVPMGANSGGPRRFEGFRESQLGLRISGAVRTLRSLRGGGARKIEKPFSGNGYQHEAVALMEAVKTNATEDARMPLMESIEIMQILDDARYSWRDDRTS